MAGNVLGTFGLIENQHDTEVKYTLTSKKIMFKKKEAQLFLIRDVTKLEQVHHRAVEEKYRGLLLSTITHDIRTPLTIIKGNIESLEEHVEKTGAGYLEAIKASANNLEYFMYDVSVCLFHAKAP